MRAPSIGWLAVCASAYFAASFTPRGEDKNLASAVWETALAALQAIAAERLRAPLGRVRGRLPNTEDRNGQTPVSKKFLDRKIAARLPGHRRRQIEPGIIPNNADFTGSSAFTATG